MKNLKSTVVLSSLILLVSSCEDKNKRADGYGNFEATEISISAESNGKLMSLEIKEGQVLKSGETIGYIDSLPLSLKRDQLNVAKEILYSKSEGVLSQIDVLKAKLKNVTISKKRIENMIKDNAATSKQLDDVNGEIDVVNQQIRGIRTQNSSVLNELKSIDVQIKQIEDQIQKSIVTNPVDGTVMVKYVEAFELVSYGKPLYKIADLSEMQLRVYISEKQLSSIKIGEEVNIKIDKEEGLETFVGKISWISEEAEFTPKIIQTKEERVALVYALKVIVKNNGRLKIGMPAEMWLSDKN